jgi:hypothetical protein
MKHSLISRARLATLMFGMLCFLGVGASLVQLYGATQIPFGCGSYVCSTQSQCEKVSGCISCSGIRCSDQP